MASLNPSSIYTPTGHDGWRFHISLSVASTSGNRVTISYRITTDRNGSSSSYIEVSATSFSINGTTVASRDYIGYGNMSDGMTVLSGTYTVSGTSFSISFVGGYYWHTSHDCDISRTINVQGLTYTVTFNLNGGTRTGGGALSQSVVYGGNATPPACSKTGHTFDHWNGSYTNVTSNRTITAVWAPIQYTITYNANGGAGAPGQQTKDYGQNLILSDTLPTRDHCRFRTWNTNINGTGISYAPGANYTANASVTLYAIWDYGVIRHGNGGFIQIYDPHEETIWVENDEGELEEQTVIVDYRNVETATDYVAHGSSYTIPNDYVSINVDPDQPIGQTFQGWSTSPSGSAQYKNGATITNVTNVINLYAIFETNTYTITFVDGFGINSKSFTVKFGETSPLPDDTENGTTNVQVSNQYVQDYWAKPGYTFTGWLGNYTNVTGNRTITALWGFTPIWIMKDGTWVAYKAREEN